jgi:prepilin-type N-terminal cleavage/methylation domain-containing protein
MTKKKYHGFTLIEVLVSVVIIAILGVVIMQSFVTTIKTSAKTEIIKDVKQNGDFVIDIITRKIHNAVSMNCSDSNKLVLTTRDAANINVVTEYSASENAGTCRIQAVETVGSNPSTTTYLSSQNLTLGTTLCSTRFQIPANGCLIIAGTHSRATFEFSLTKKPTANAFANYENSAQKFSATVSLLNVSY